MGRYLGFLLVFLSSLCSLSAENLRLLVEGVERSAQVVMPAKPQGAPLVFVFHGHGGTARHAQLSFHLEQLWPEAIVVYPQGLPTKGQLTDPEGKKSGWQGKLHSEGDRDLKFFLAMLDHFSRYSPAKTYATGHSNGGGFSYLLLAVHPDKLSAIASSSAVCVADFHLLTPKPIMHLAGTEDPLVKWNWQRLMIERLKKLNGCAGPGQVVDAEHSVFPGAGGNDLETFVYKGGHTFHAKGPEKIVEFFRRH